MNITTNRAAGILLALLVVFAGCSGISTDDSGTVQCDSQFTTEIDLDKFSNLNRTTAIEIAKVSERNIAASKVEGTETTDISVRLSEPIVQAGSDGYIVSFQTVDVTFEANNMATGDDGWSSSYYVNQSVLMRGQKPTYDAHNWSRKVIYCF